MFLSDLRLWVIVTMCGISCLLVSSEASFIPSSEYQDYTVRFEESTDRSRNFASCKCTNGTCEMEKGKAVCKCPPEYGFYNKTMGETYEGCKACACGKGFNCTFEPIFLFFDGKKCICDNGYKEVRGFCKGPCSPNPCLNNGICEDEGNSSVCFCPSFYSGRLCEIALCPDQPCMNEGSCRVEGNNFTCVCRQNYSGERCELDPCVENPCQNGGTCHVENFSFKCKCDDPFLGTLCEEDLCSSNPCLNGGLCKIVGRTFNCSCIEPYSGSICERDACFYDPCKNGGICKIDGNAFKCFCKHPYFGKTCQNDACSHSPCKNGGTCVLDKNSFKCECKNPYFGATCERVLLMTSTLTQTDTSITSVPTSVDSEIPSNNTHPTEEISLRTRTTDDTVFYSRSSSIFTNTLQSDSSTATTPKEEAISWSANTRFTDLTDTTVKEPTYTSVNDFSTPSPYFTESSTTSKLIVSEATGTTTYETSTPIFTASPTTPSECYCGDKSTSCYFDVLGKKICICLTGYKQKGNICSGTCSRNEDCLSGGICKGYGEEANFCECPSDFFGDWCESSDICEKLIPRCNAFGAVCRRTGRSATCECPPEKMFNWKSGVCENICDSRTCQHGRCQIFGNNFICKCDEGYFGTRCDEILNKELSEGILMLFYIALATIVFLLLIGTLYLLCRIKKLEKKTYKELH